MVQTSVYICGFNLVPSFTFYEPPHWSTILYGTYVLRIYDFMFLLCNNMGSHHYRISTVKMYSSTYNLNRLHEDDCLQPKQVAEISEVKKVYSCAN